MKIKSNSILVIAFCIIFSIFSGWVVLLSNKGLVNEVKFEVPALNTTVSLYDTGDNLHYAFLPSCSDLNEVHFFVGNNYKVFINQKEHKTATQFNVNQKYKLEIKNLLGFTVSSTTLIVMKAENVPALSIDINNATLDTIHSDINIKKAGTIVSASAESQVLYSGNIASISGRGNSSWGKVKRPYNLDFDSEVDLIGFGPSKEYALLANATENSNLRNKIVFDTAQKFGLNFSPDSGFVDLYINGEYLGLYLLVEKFQVSESHINLTYLQENTESINQFNIKTYSEFSADLNGLPITGYNIPNNPEDITGGYIVEVDPRIALSDNTFHTPQMNFSVYYPSACSQEQMSYISTLFNKIENGLADDSYLQYIDLTSWVKYYLIQEFFANVDVASFFFYKDSDMVNSKVYAGPVWDFELSIGLGGYECGVNGRTNPYRFYVNSWGWFAALFEQKSFVDAVEKIYANEFKCIVENLLLTDIDSYQNYISSSALMNHIRWKNEQFCDWFEFEETLQGNVSYIRTFLAERIKCFDTTFIEKKSAVKITLISEDIIEETSHFYVSYASKIDTLKTLSDQNHTFLGWVDENGKSFDNTQQVTEDIVFTAQWQDEADLQATTKPEFSWTAYLHYLGYFAIIVIFLSVAFFFFSDIYNTAKKCRKRKRNDR